MNKIIQEKSPELKNLNLKLKEPISCSEKKTKGKKSRHTSLKFQNTREKEKILKASREGTKTGYLINFMFKMDFRFVKIGTIKQKDNTFKILRESYFQPRILFPTELSSIDRLKTFSDIQDLQKYPTYHFSKKLLEEILPQNKKVIGSRKQVRDNGNPLVKDDNEEKSPADSCIAEQIEAGQRGSEGYTVKMKKIECLMHLNWLKGDLDKCRRNG